MLAQKIDPSGIRSGFPELDRITGGFQPGELIIVAARPSMGKTAFTLNIAAAKVQVYAISGQLVKSFVPNGNIDFQCGVSDLKAGLYVVKAFDQNDKIQVMKFIKK